MGEIPVEPRSTPQPRAPEPLEGKDADRLWEMIGFHRPLGGWMYNYILGIVGIFAGLLLVGVYAYWLYPYPESKGYEAIIAGLFNLMFQLFDVGTAYGLERFIGEYRVKNPRRMFQYIQFFIWYQSFTGLVQITVMAMWVVWAIPGTNLAYAGWIILLISTRQFPGWLSFFGSALGGLQRHNIKNSIEFIMNNVVQLGTEICFVLVGRAWGQADPAVGEIMGIALGAIVGLYVDDFIATAFMAHYFTKVVRPLGYSARDCFRRDFDWAIAKECLAFGLQVALPGLIGSVTAWMETLLWITFVPQFTTFIVLSGIAMNLANVVEMGGTISMTPAIAESYQNGKMRLCNFYLNQSLKYSAFVGLLMGGVIIGLVPLLVEPLVEFVGGAAESYALAAPFMIPWVLRKIIQPFVGLADTIMVGTGRVRRLAVVRLLEEVGKISLQFLWIVVLRIPMQFGVQGVAWVLACGILPAVFVKSAYLWWYANAKVLPLHIQYWQILAVPILAGGTCIVLLMSMFQFIFLPVAATSGFLVAVAIIAPLGLVIIPVLVYMPLYGFLGGWDDYGLETMRRAMLISGPSKFIVKLLYRSTRWAAHHSPLHNRFPITSAEAIAEAAALQAQKEAVEAAQKGP